MEGDSQLELFQSDMSSAFYLFRIPDCWKPHLAFNIIASGLDLGLDDDRQFALSCAVIPMGWLNSVGVMQEISENLLYILTIFVLEKELTPIIQGYLAKCAMMRQRMRGVMQA